MCPDIDAPKIDVFTNIYPAFLNIDIDIKEFWLDQAKQNLCLKSLCKNWEIAVYLYIAHFLTVNNSGSAANPMTPGQKIKTHTAYDVTTTFDNTDSADKSSGRNPFQGSVFGNQLYAMIKRSGIRVLNTGMIKLC